jgi:DNA-binding NarL/FixJ family response regulator
MKKIRVLLADDHQIVLDGLQIVLANDDAIAVVGQATNGEEVLQFVKANNVDVVVLDINMPVLDGLHCARRLKKDFPAIRIIVLTMYAQKYFLEEIIRLGIDGCLLKNNSGKDLREAIIRVVEGRSYFDLVQDFNVEKQVRPINLSDREIMIIKYVAQGLNSAQIAMTLFISEHTVKTHRKNILKKTGTKSTGELVQFALNQKLL